MYLTDRELEPDLKEICFSGISSTDRYVLMKI